MVKEQATENHGLSPWVQRAIEEGQYTPKQVAILRDQRQKVVDSIAAAEQEHKQAMEKSLVPGQVQRSAMSPSVDANPHLPSPVITEVEDLHMDSCPQPKLKVFPHCNYRSCHACRPTFRDRAWQVLEPVFANDFLLPTRCSGENRRRLCDADIVRNIGVHEPRPTRPTLQSFGSIGLYSTTPTDDFEHNNTAYKRSADSVSSYALANAVDVTDARNEHESRGFRDSMKRAFRGMLSSRRRDSTLSRRSTKSRPRLWLSEEGEEEASYAVEFDMSLWRQLNNELLQIAAEVSLPGHDGMDGLSDEECEVEVQDGVAVTEEGIDLGTADIIMSV